MDLIKVIKGLLVWAALFCGPAWALWLIAWSPATMAASWSPNGQSGWTIYQAGNCSNDAEARRAACAQIYSPTNQCTIHVVGPKPSGCAVLIYDIYKYLGATGQACPSGYTWSTTDNTCWSSNIYSECVASGKTLAECDTPDKPPLALDFPQDLTRAQVCALKNGIPYCLNAASWPTNCGEVNQKWTCVESLPSAGINFGAHTPSSTVRDSNGQPRASNPQGTAVNYSHTNNNFQGQYAYQGPGSSTGVGTLPGTGGGLGEGSTEGLAQDSTLQGVKSDTADIKTVLDGTADVTGLDPEAKTDGLGGLVDDAIEALDTDVVSESDWISSIFPLPTESACQQLEQPIQVSVYTGSFVVDPCDLSPLVKTVLGWYFYGLTFLYVVKLAGDRP